MGKAIFYIVQKTIVCQTLAKLFNYCNFSNYMIELHFNVSQERSAQCGRLHQVSQWDQPDQAAPRRDHQSAKKRRRACRARSGV